MSVWGKVIGGVAGFALGGPLGAMMGVMAGNIYDKKTENILYSSRDTQSAKAIPRDIQSGKTTYICTQCHYACS